MFEIVITEEQLINTLTILKSGKEILFDSKRINVITVITECRFITVTKNSNEFYARLKSLGEDVELWAGNQLCPVSKIEELEHNPFRITIAHEILNLFDYNFDALLLEKHCMVQKNKRPNVWNIPHNIANQAEEILIYDQYFLRNMENSVYTIASLFKEFGINIQSRVFIISSALDGVFIKNHEIEKYYIALEENGFNKVNFFLLAIESNYHDRDFFCNTMHIKSGGSFNFMKFGSDVFQNKKSSAFDLKSMLKATRYNDAWEIIDIIFRSCEKKYCRNQSVTAIEKQAAEGFENTEIYKYWNLNKN